MDPADIRRRGRPKRRGREGGLRVLVADERGRSVPANGLATWLRRVAPARARGTVSIALVSDERIRALNRRYRRTDYATDVLSFPTSAPPEKNSPPFLSSVSSVSSVVESFLGEIVIARGVAKRQAREVGHSEATELRVLALHGLLHLLGYDHESDDGEMRRVEERLRRKGGLAAGLIGRRRSRLGTREGHGPGAARLEQSRESRPPRERSEQVKVAREGHRPSASGAEGRRPPRERSEQVQVTREGYGPSASGARPRAIKR